LPPQIAPDIPGRYRPFVEITPCIANRQRARRHASVDLTDDDRPAATKMDDARFEIVGAEIHEGADSTFAADDVGDLELVQSILRRDDAAAGGEMRAQCAD